MESLLRTPLPTRILTLLAVGVVAVTAAACGGSSTAKPATSSTAPSSSHTASPITMVLGPAYAKSVGFPKTAVAAKASSNTKEANCPQSAQAAYEDAAGKTGLVSETLVCNTVAAATAALDGVKKQVKADPSIHAPASLGSSAFVSATQAPQYTVIWQNHNRVGVTAIDVSVGGSSTTPTTKAPAITAAQTSTLTSAAVAQNALFH